MELLRKRPQPMKRFNAIDSRIDYSSSAYMNAWVMLQDKMTNKIDYKKQEEEDPCPPQITTQPERSEQLLDEWVLSHPPKNNRQICDDLLEEWHTGADKRLEWLMSSVEEEDNEKKNNETFGP